MCWRFKMQCSLRECILVLTRLADGLSATRESCFCSAEQITVQGKTGTAENTGSSAKSLNSFGRTAVRLLTGPRRTV